MRHRFTVFIDESGDEGFSFKSPPDKGSSDWFVVSAVATFSDHQDQIISAGKAIREALGRDDKWTIHFADMSHAQRLKALNIMAEQKVLISSVAVDKRSIRDVETFTAHRFRLYFYSLRLLLERVSWLCRDTAAKNTYPSCLARVVLEHKRRLDHNDLVSYIRGLRGLSDGYGWIAPQTSDIRIHWDAIHSAFIESAQKHQFVGLQLADLAASSIRTALEVDRYGLTEHRYAKTLAPKFYKRGGNYLSYGLKFFPAPPDETNGFMHWVYKHCKG